MNNKCQFLPYSAKRKKLYEDYNLTGNSLDQEMCNISQILANICQASFSYITIFTEDNFNVKGLHGVTFPDVKITDPRVLFCTHTVLAEDIFEVEDAANHELFKLNPYVSGFPFIKYYAGIKLVSDGMTIGTLCIVDDKPRKMTEPWALTMKSFAKHIIDFLELRKKNKELLYLNEEMKNLSRAKEDFFNNMSHELRTPLNAIYGFIDVLKRTPLIEEQRDYISIIDSSLEFLIRMINDILDFSKIESGKIQPIYNPFNLYKTIKQLTNLFEPKCVEKGIMLKLVYDTNIPNIVVGDKLRLNQILTNLIGNAIKFTNLGFVEISANLEKDNEKECKVKFCITDTGIGMTPEECNKIFERYTQANDSTYKNYGGTGLGLNISKTLVELLSSKLELESHVYEGSKFYFTLNFKKLKENDLKNNIDPINKQDDINIEYDLRILLCEDTEFNVKLIRKLLENNYIRLDVAENGKIGIEKLKTNKYDLILMDLHMPIMDGYEATEFIRNKYKMNIPIVAITANKSESERQKCLKLGMNSYLSKPFKSNTLLKL